MTAIGARALLLAMLMVSGPIMAGAQESGPLTVPPPAAADALTSDQQQAVRALIRDYLLNNPEVIVDAIRALRERERQAQGRRQRSVIRAHREALFNDPQSPVAGNPDGDVTIVEFFDYRCGYCKRIFPTLMKTLESDGNIRLVLKEFPILGPDSRFAARAALAARKQEKYEVFHRALMRVRGTLSEETVMAVARSTGLDTERLTQDMDDPAITSQIDLNLALAQALGIRGTPTFIIGERMVPGAVSAETLRTLIAEARKPS